MKICCACKIEKAFAEFHKNSAKADGYHNQCKSCRKLHYNNNRERILEYNISWNKRNRHVIKKHNDFKRTNIEERARRLWLSARIRARSKGLLFDLSLSRITVALMIGTCERTGITFDLEPQDKYKFHPFAPSVDKINPFGNYTNDNIKIVCNMYNIGKHQFSHEQFVEFCRKVVEFNK